MLINESRNVITDPKPAADMLQNQFISVFIDLTSLNIKEPDFPVPDILNLRENLGDYSSISNESIIDAISNISSDSANEPDGIPVILHKNCDPKRCEPIRLLLWSESFELRRVNNFYKHEQISPLYKKGDRAKAVNYRQASLTSHIVQIHEIIFREKMVTFIEKIRSGLS